ncbi:MAG: hypothetical protein IJC27_00740 [Lentisphaeria bacterium]|nr:hypothetical protein [Lentisphaeria bacterium]
MKKIFLKNLLMISMVAGICKAANAQDMNSQLAKLEARLNAKLGIKEQPAPAKSSSSLVIYKTTTGENCRFYAFTYTEELEGLLKSIAKLHWKANESADLYIQLKDYANDAIKKQNARDAKTLVDEAEKMLNITMQRRRTANEHFEEMLKKGYSFYNSKNIAARTEFTGIPDEFIAFMVETAEKGKYVRAWAWHVKGGMEVTLDGRNVVIK